MADRETVQRVKDATDLVALVGQAVNLRKQGSAWVGRCPFHTERSPSFQVVPDRGFYHCFGCGKHGDVFTWLQEREGLTFGEALEQLARAAGIELPKFRERPSGEVDLEARLRGVLEQAQAFYQRRLRDSELAKDYLVQRGIGEAFGQEVGFGFAPDGFDHLLNHLRQQGASTELLEQAGLVGRNERGSLYDFLRHRLTLPIHDARGRIVAFGGRAFGDAKPKYLNTRETAVFQKGGVLFGFHRAKGHMKDGALVVEGYFDVLQLHQQGIHQAVAPMGTALTEQHLALVGRFSKRLVLCFDGDAAGLRAMEKTLRLALPKGFDVRLLMLPAGEDPDTWCLKVGAEAFKELVRLAPDWTAFVVDRAMEGKDFRRVPDRMEALKELAEFLVYLPPSLERREFFASLAHQLQIPFTELERAMQARSAARHGMEEEEEYALPPQPMIEVDDLLRPLLLLTRDEAFRVSFQAIPPAWWEALPGAPVLQALLDAEGDEQALPPEILAYVRRLEASWATKDEAERVPETALLKLEYGYVMREIQSLTRQMGEAGVRSDPRLAQRVEASLAELLVRKTRLGKRMRHRV